MRMETNVFDCRFLLGLYGLVPAPPFVNGQNKMIKIMKLWYILVFNYSVFRVNL